MAEARRRYTHDVPAAVEERLRAICSALPAVHEEHAWAGTRWRVRTRTFAHVLGVDDPVEGPSVALVFRSAGEELEALRHVGHPFSELGWGRGAMRMVLDDDTDWQEVAEIVTESYCVMAPRRLAAAVDRPDPA